MESMSINGCLSTENATTKKQKSISKPYFIIPARRENPFWGHTISYHSPSMWLNVFIPVNPHFPIFCFENSAFLDPLIQMQPTVGSILFQYVNNPHLVTLMCFLTDVFPFSFLVPLLLRLSLFLPLFSYTPSQP